MLQISTKNFVSKKCQLLLKLMEFLYLMRFALYPGSCGTPTARVVGSAMDMACLHNVYRTLDEDATTKSTTYIMQLLWHDPTSPFDVVGPYYSSGVTLEAKFILEIIKVFHFFGFNTSLLVCDEASSNLSTIKSTMGVSGVFGRDSSH